MFISPILITTTFVTQIRGCLHGKTRTGASFIPGWLPDFVSRLHDDRVFSSSHVQSVEANEAILDWQKLRMRYPFQSTWKPISHRSEWSFRVYMIRLRNLALEWNSRPVREPGWTHAGATRAGMTFLWWYHVNKCKAMRGNPSELTLARKSPRCHVNTP